MIGKVFLSSSQKHGIRRKWHCRLTSSVKDPFFITTPIYYVNGDPHIGHAYTSILSDTIARFQRKDNKDVYFLTGTDEHGQKVEQSAKNANLPTLQYATDVSNKFRTLLSSLNCSNDEFIRTTDPKHKESVKELWKRLEANGQIYLGTYEGWYSVRDECFYPEDDLIGGKAPTGAEVEWVKEESYFFRLSEYTDKLLAFYDAHPDFIAPAGRRSEIVSFVGQEGGLRDISISRTTFMWGIPVPGNETHVMYVWLDALANYISALDYPNVSTDRFSKYWPASLHVVGKDILRFHAVYWPAFLMAAELEPPKRIFAHGWWTKDGEKMSKSVGNVVCPMALISQYGVDPLRYFLMATFTTGNDGDFSHDLLQTRINADLVNNLGNLVQRVITMVHRDCGGLVPQPNEFTLEDHCLLHAARHLVDTLRTHVAEQKLHSMCEAVMQVSDLGNKYFFVEQPWILAKSDPERLATVLYVVMEQLRCCAICLEPVMPATSARMMDQLGLPEDLRTFGSLSSIPLRPGLPLGKVEHLFTRLHRTSTPIVTPFVPKKQSQKSQNIQQTKTVCGAALLELTRKYGSMCPGDLQTRLSEVISVIRSMKLSKAQREDLKPFLDELHYLKARCDGDESEPVKDGNIKVTG